MTRRRRQREEPGLARSPWPPPWPAPLDAHAGWRDDPAGTTHSRWWNGRTWTYRTRSRWTTPLIATGVACAVALGLAMTAFGFWAYANHDRLELLDSDIVSDRALRACEQLRANLPAVTQDSSARPTPASVRDETLHVRTLVSDVRSVGATALAKDRPAVDWLADWERLATLRDDYADELERDSTARRPTMPTVDGYALAHRMGSVGVVGCNVPLQILDDFDLVAPTTNRAKACESSEDAPMCIDKARVTFTGLAAGSQVDVIIILGTERTRVSLTADQRGTAEAPNPAPPGAVVTVLASAIAKWTDRPVTYALAAQPA